MPKTGGGGGGWKRVQRPVGALAQVCVSGPQNRKRLQEGINSPSELSRSLSRHNHGAAGGGHPINELPCILHQTRRSLCFKYFYQQVTAACCLETCGTCPSGKKYYIPEPARTMTMIQRMLPKMSISCCGCGFWRFYFIFIV